jgi:hypothetical protein
VCIQIRIGDGAVAAVWDATDLAVIVGRGAPPSQVRAEVEGILFDLGGSGAALRCFCGEPITWPLGVRVALSWAR